MRCRSTQSHIFPFRVKCLLQKIQSCALGVGCRAAEGPVSFAPGIAFSVWTLSTSLYGGGGSWTIAVSGGIGAGGLTGSCIIDAYHGFGATVRPRTGSS